MLQHQCFYVLCLLCVADSCVSSVLSRRTQNTYLYVYLFQQFCFDFFSTSIPFHLGYSFSSYSSLLQMPQHSQLCLVPSTVILQPSIVHVDSSLFELLRLSTPMRYENDCILRAKTLESLSLSLNPRSLHFYHVVVVRFP